MDLITSMAGTKKKSIKISRFKQPSESSEEEESKEDESEQRDVVTTELAENISMNSEGKKKATKKICKTTAELINFNNQTQKKCKILKRGKSKFFE